MLSKNTREAFIRLNAFFFGAMLDDPEHAPLHDAFRLVTQHVMLSERAAEIADSLFADPQGGMCPGCGCMGDVLAKEHANNPPTCPVMIYSASRSLTAFL